MSNRLGYNFTVISAKRNGNKLKVTIKNTGLAPAFFNISLCAEITDSNGNKLKNFGKPVLIEKGTFHDEDEKAFLFEYDGELDENATICLAMYDTDNPLVEGKNPTVKFDNKNTLSTNRMELVESDYVEGDVINGDIAISVDTVAKNAKEYGVTFDQELMRVMIHGVLHLTGQGDKSDEEFKEMKRKEGEALSLIDN